VLSATTRRRVIPASFLLTSALGAGLLGATIPAQAAPVTTAATVTPAAAVAAPTTVVTRTVSATALTPAQTAAARAVAARKLAAARVAHKRVVAVKVARSKVGARYRAGMAGPTRFDCSGLAMYVARAAYGKRLPHYSKAQFLATKRVSKGQLRPGDLVFFFKRGAHHVGVYIGRGLMVSATNPRHGVKIDAVFSGWYGSRYSGAGRLV
jgi:cell wall-associated NlpC family hydrolase